MPLSALIVSRDSQEVSVFECILGGLRIDVDIEPELSRALARLRKSKVDALILDCDLPGAVGFLRSLQQKVGPGAGPVVIVSGSENQERLEAMGAEFIAQKPVSVEHAVHTLSAARNLILKGRLRYHRQTLETPVSITRTQEQINADLLNLSQGGIRVRLQKPQALGGEVGIHFRLPGTEHPFDAQGEVAWTDTRGNAGIRLLAMSEPTKRDLRLWLERQYFQTGGD